MFSKYDIIFLNGWSTFNTILADFINVYELVKIDGYIVINNISQPGIFQLIDLIINNYQFLKKLNIDNNKIAVFKKFPGLFDFNKNGQHLPLTQP